MRAEVSPFSEGLWALWEQEGNKTFTRRQFGGMSNQIIREGGGHLGLKWRKKTSRRRGVREDPCFAGEWTGL